MKQFEWQGNMLLQSCDVMFVVVQCNYTYLNAKNDKQQKRAMFYVTQA